MGTDNSPSFPVRGFLFVSCVRPWNPLVWEAVSGELCSCLMPAFKTLLQRKFKVRNLIFWRWVSLRSLCWPGTCCVDQVGLKLLHQLILLPQPLRDSKNVSEDRPYLDSWSSGHQAWQVSGNSVSLVPSEHPVGMESVWKPWLDGFGKDDSESGGRN